MTPSRHCGLSKVSAKTSQPKDPGFAAICSAPKVDDQGGTLSSHFDTLAPLRPKWCTYATSVLWTPLCWGPGCHCIRLNRDPNEFQKTTVVEDKGGFPKLRRSDARSQKWQSQVVYQGSVGNGSQRTPNLVATAEVVGWSMVALALLFRISPHQDHSDCPSQMKKAQECTQVQAQR